MKIKITLRPYANFKLLCTLFISALVFGCSSDNEKNEVYQFTDIEGVVLRPVGCTRDSYWLEIDKIMPENGDLNLIGVIDLPEEFKQAGLKLSFSMRKFKDPQLACVADKPYKFYEIGNLTLKP